jgi:hypothetical protein
MCDVPFYCQYGYGSAFWGVAVSSQKRRRNRLRDTGGMFRNQTAVLTRNSNGMLFSGGLEENKGANARQTMAASVH